MRDPASDEYLAYEIFSDAAPASRWSSRHGVDTADGEAPVGGEHGFFRLMAKCTGKRPLSKRAAVAIRWL